MQLSYTAGLLIGRTAFCIALHLLLVKQRCFTSSRLLFSTRAHLLRKAFSLKISVSCGTGYITAVPHIPRNIWEWATASAARASQQQQVCQLQGTRRWSVCWPHCSLQNSPCLASHWLSYDAFLPPASNRTTPCKSTCPIKTSTYLWSNTSHL